MKILYVDYIEQTGHVNFNRIHIDALKGEGNDVRIAVHESIARRLPYKPDDYALTFPSSLGQKRGHGMRNRLCFLAALLKVRAHLLTHHYDRVVVASADELTLAMLPPSGNLVVVCHGNANALVDGGIKKRCLLRLGKKARFVVFNDDMAKPFADNGLDVKVVSHGCVPAFRQGGDCRVPETEGFDHVLFHPSAKRDDALVESMLADVAFREMLEQSNSLVLLNGNGENHGRIRFVNRRLDDDEYRKVFLGADIILMFYPDSFRYRVSGVSFECLSNHKPFLVKKSPVMDYCSQLCSYDPFVSTISELGEKAAKLMENTESIQWATEEQVVPSYKDVL